MKCENLTKEELINLILYGIKENGINNFSDMSKINYILKEYYNLCYCFKKFYIIGELDTFKRAACLLVAINKGGISLDRKINASIAIDTAYKMCEKPYWNIGEHHDIPKKLEEVNFKEVFYYDMTLYDDSKKMLMDALVCEGGVSLTYYLNLELFYRLALQLKNKNQNEKKVSSDNYVEEKVIYSQEETLKNKILRLIRKN